MRIRVLLSFFALAWMILLIRIYYISIKSNTYYEEIAKRNAIKTEYLVPLRGSIKDTNGKPLSVNILGFSIAVKPHLSYKSKREMLEKKLTTLAKTFSTLDKDKLEATYLKEDSPYGQDFVKVVDFIPYDEMMPHLSKLSLDDDLEIKPASKRHYPYGKLASHVIGYVAKANKKDIKKDPVSKLTGYIGRAGVERYYNAQLQGKRGKREVKVTAFNQEIEQLSKTLPHSSDIELTIDLRLQKYISDIFGDDAGVALVMSVKDGSILAAGSFPEYDINKFVTGISYKEWDEITNDPNHPFTNKMVNGLYPPGSVIKMGVALSFLDSHQLTRHSTIFDNGVTEVGGRKFRDWKLGGHGTVDMNKAIRESVDTYFFRYSLKVGIDNIAPVLKKLGFGNKTNVDLPNEFVGTVPSRQWKLLKYNRPWYHGETLNTSIGQGDFLVTPLQVAKYTAILATGKDITPHFIKSIDGKKVKFDNNSTVLTPYEISQLPYIRKAMYEVVYHQHGTARRALQDSKVTIAAKTGTAQVVGISQTDKKRIKEKDMEYFKRSHAWLTTYGPYKKPQYVVVVLSEHGGHVGYAAGPIAAKIYNKLLELKYIKNPKKSKRR